MNVSQSDINPKQLLKLVGVGVFMFWFLQQLESSISVILRKIILFPPIEINYLIVYPINEFLALGVTLLFFFKLTKSIKQNYESENYLKKMIILFIIGIVFFDLLLFATPFIITDPLMTNFDFNQSYEKSNRVYVETGTLIVTFIIKIIVLAYAFLKNRNFQNSSASS